MQFIPNGPDIDNELLQSQEEGRVVFFCGAGISYPAGLSGFEGLVDGIYSFSGTDIKSYKPEFKAFKDGNYDLTLDLLERRLPGGRLSMRSALAEQLKPDLKKPGAMCTHMALLRLARNREGVLRLVTTNFDRVFHAAANYMDQSFCSYAAPMLPVPKNSRWDGIVYLHGLLTEEPNDTDLNRLVVTSGDFGLAYLTERWAARFVSELFRNYVVCFVGYSIEDTVLRYMMDALAADRTLGEFTPRAWAFVGFKPGTEQEVTEKWEIKGVTPILYEKSNGSHSLLHRTLHAWADTHRDGVGGKEAIIVNNAQAKPQDTTKQDDFVGRMLWALSDKSGLPAKRFADLNPVPSLDWLEPFSKNCFQNSDLNRFGVQPTADNSELRFSLVSRLCSSGVEFSEWDTVMFHLGRWLIRHLNDPTLVIWIAKLGQPHESLRIAIENRLEELAFLESNDKTSEINEILAHSTNAIPDKRMRTLWNMLLSGRVKASWKNFYLERWMRRFMIEGLTTSLRLELREMLAPKVLLEKPFNLYGDDSSTTKIPQMSQLVSWEFELAADNVHCFFREAKTNAEWVSALLLLLEDFQQLLRDALDLKRELDESDEYSDKSFLDLPSITPHWQNRGFCDWVTLIELLRDSWLEVYGSDTSQATCIAQNWFRLPYPTFKRLALFAASKDNCIVSKQWVDWLLSDNSRWLWSLETKREVFRLYHGQGNQLTKSDQKRLERAILSGPDSEKHRGDLDENQWQKWVKRSVWLHLAKLKAAADVLGSAAEKRLTEISKENPDWKLANNERDEFSTWISVTGDPGHEDLFITSDDPPSEELAQWLDDHGLNNNAWHDACRNRFEDSMVVLRALAERGQWPTEQWHEALQVWSKSHVSHSWRDAAPHLNAMPDDVFKEIIRPVAWWMGAVSKSINRHDNVFLELSRRVLDHPTEVSDINLDSVSSAINHPIGLVTQALIDLCFNSDPNDNNGLPEEIKPLFTQLCDIQFERYCYGRLLLGTNAIALFRVDPGWTREYLLPLFDWSNTVEATFVWKGFLWSPRLHQPFLLAIKKEFLDTATHYEELGDRHNFAAFLTYAALNFISTDEYSKEEFRLALAALPQQGLEKSAQALYQSLEATGQREEYWKNRILPFWHIWPKDLNRRSPRIAESLALLVIAARNEFTSALDKIYEWLQPIKHPNHLVDLLSESGLCEKHPKQTLRLLCAVIDDNSYPPIKLLSCLESMKSCGIDQDERNFQRLDTYCKKNEI